MDKRMILTATQVRSFLEAAGFTGNDLNNAVRICYCESGYNTKAHNTSGEDSRGLMQINVSAHPVYKPLDLFDPEMNSMIAFEIYKDAGYTFRDWSCAYILGILKKNTPVNDGIIIMAAIAIIGSIVLYYS